MAPKNVEEKEKKKEDGDKGYSYWIMVPLASSMGVEGANGKSQRHREGQAFLPGLLFLMFLSFA